MWEILWAVLTKDHFSVGEYNKLSAKEIRPVENVEKINSNAYRLRLPSHVRTTNVFNMKHLISFYGDSSDDEMAANSRSNFFCPGENDVDEMALAFLKHRNAQRCF